MHPRGANRSHEVGVPGPPRHDVNVKVILNPRPGGPTQIHSNIESGRLVSFPESCLRPLGEIHQLVSRFFRAGVKLRRMFVGNDKQVSRDIGVDVEDNEVEASTIKDEILLVFAGIALNLTEDAFVGN